MALKYLQDLYNRAPEKMKSNPSFLKRLEYIDEYIQVATNSDDYQFVNFDFNLTDDMVAVDLFYTYGKGSFTPDTQRRAGSIFNIQFDKDGNLKCEETRISANNVGYGSRISFGNSVDLISPDGNVIRCNKIQNLSGESILVERLVPEFRYDMSNNNFKSSDQDLRSYAFHMERFIGHSYYTEWSATRDSNYPNMAFVHEDLHTKDGGCITAINDRVPIQDANFRLSYSTCGVHSGIVTVEQAEEFLNQKSMNGSHRR